MNYSDTHFIADGEQFIANATHRAESVSSHGSGIM